MRKAGQFALLAVIVGACAFEEGSYVPKEGFVPDSTTAIRIAEAVFIPIYGESNIRSEEPFVARLSNNVWTVEGTLPTNYMGGVAMARISKEDGRILWLIHGK
jgi:hypothetical protein